MILTSFHLKANRQVRITSVKTIKILNNKTISLTRGLTVTTTTTIASEGNHSHVTVLKVNLSQKGHLNNQHHFTILTLSQCRNRRLSIVSSRQRLAKTTQTIKKPNNKLSPI
jgi:hypothetical protein